MRERSCFPKRRGHYSQKKEGCMANKQYIFTEYLVYARQKFWKQEPEPELF